MPNESDPVPSLELKDVTAGWQRDMPVFDGFSVTMRGAGLVHVAGPNGSGKSTLVELASGYLHPWRGHVLVCSHAAASRRARNRRRVCRTAPALYPHMTARDHLVFAARCAGVDPAAGLARSKSYGLSPWWEAPAESLSTGNRRKLWLILCTIGEFDLLLLDEPFNGLDEDGVVLLRQEISRWREDCCVVLVAHAVPSGLCVDHRLELKAPAMTASDGATP